ncbi:hypothetical protein D3C73_761220 [compost metagenome]
MLQYTDLVGQTINMLPAEFGHFIFRKCRVFFKAVKRRNYFIQKSGIAKPDIFPGHFFTKCPGIIPQGHAMFLIAK